MCNGRKSQGLKERGFTLVAALLGTAVMGLALAATGDIWSQSRQRDREIDLLFAGNEIRTAISQYYERTPGGGKQYPATLEDLLQDKRYPTVQRHLRKVYADPMTGKAEWGLIAAPTGGIMGVYSLSAHRPIKRAGFWGADAVFEGADSYAGWQFAYVPKALQAPAAAPAAPPPASGKP
jgi:type II secretory pathway pseudopilin PulG